MRVPTIAAGTTIVPIPGGGIGTNVVTTTAATGMIQSIANPTKKANFAKKKKRGIGDGEDRVVA